MYKFTGYSPIKMVVKLNDSRLRAHDNSLSFYCILQCSCSLFYLSICLSIFLYLIHFFFILRVNKLLIVSFHSYTFYFCSSEEKRVYLDCTRFNFGFCLQRVDAYTIFTRTLYMFATFSVSPFSSSQMEHKFKEHCEKPNILKIGIPCLFVICRSF